MNLQADKATGIGCVVEVGTRDAIDPRADMIPGATIR